MASDLEVLTLLFTILPTEGLMMRSYASFLLSGIVALTWAVSSNATTITHADSATARVGGTTVTLEGNLANFGGPGAGTARWSSIGDGGDPTNLQGTTGGTDPASDDYYWEFKGADFTGMDPLPTATYRYLEIFYEISGGSFTGNDNRLRLQTTNQGQAFDDFPDPTVPADPGAHRIIVDLLSDDGSTLAGTWSGDWTFLRFDVWNDPGNSGITYTLDKVVYGSDIVPEPTTLGFVTLVSIGMLASRKRTLGA
jgi:hypothetical protein